MFKNTVSLYKVFFRRLSFVFRLAEINFNYYLNIFGL